MMPWDRHLLDFTASGFGGAGLHECLGQLYPLPAHWGNVSPIVLLF